MSVQITGKTRLLGLIADPVAQARSPDIANDLLQRGSQFGAFVLVPMHVATDGLDEFVGALKQLKNFAGGIVSMPHKTRMAELADELTPEAKLIGAVNVIRRDRTGRLVGTVLDGEGFVGGLISNGHRVTDANCLLVGAGGAASAIAFALAKHGCKSLTLINRTPSKAEVLATRVRTAFPALAVACEAPVNATFDIAVNGTSLGMREGDDLPIPNETIRRCSLVAECVIAPEMTRLLQTAKDLGCRVHAGVHMLTSQMKMMLQFMGAL